MATKSAKPDVVGAIYDAALDPALWPAALEQMAEAFDTASAAVGFLDADSRIAFRAHARIDERAVSEYADRYRFIDPVFRAVSSRAPGQAYSDEMFVPKAELWRSRLYDEWCRPHDLVHAIQAFASRDAEHSAFITLSRSRREEAFSLAEVDTVTALLPHIARAFQIQKRLQAAHVAKESTADALDRIPQAVMLVDAQARVLHANRAAVGLLQSGHALDAGPLGLHASCPEQTNLLHGLIARASGLGPERGGSVLLRHPDGGDRLVAHVVPCRGARAEAAWLGGDRPAAMVIVASPHRDGAVGVERALQALFGLTPAEARAACLVAKGIGVEAAAAALGAKPSTVHTHLVRAYQKTGTGRQAELAELVGQVASAVGSGSGP